MHVALFSSATVVSDVQAYSKPPPLVDITLSGVMTVLKRPGSWEEAKKALGDANFMMKLLNFDKVTAGGKARDNSRVPTCMQTACACALCLPSCAYVALVCKAGEHGRVSTCM